MKSLTQMTSKELNGRVAYNGYCSSSKGKSLISGVDLPLWSELKPEIQTAWIESAQAVITHMRNYL